MPSYFLIVIQSTHKDLPEPETVENIVEAETLLEAIDKMLAYFRESSERLRESTGEGLTLVQLQTGIAFSEIIR